MTVLFTALIVGCLVVAAIMWPSRPQSSGSSGPAREPEPPTLRQSFLEPVIAASPMPPVHRTLRQQQIAEEAAAIAEEFSEREELLWRQSLREKARELLAD